MDAQLKLALRSAHDMNEYLEVHTGQEIIDHINTLRADLEQMEEARLYATQFLESYVRKYCNPIPEWKPLPDLIGVLTQIDNASTITGELVAKLERARKALEQMLAANRAYTDAYANRDARNVAISLQEAAERSARDVLACLAHKETVRPCASAVLQGQEQEMTNHPNRSKTNEEIAVVITTEHRGVFFGYIDPKDSTKDIIAMRAARNCVYWSHGVRGFMGLAATGPDKQSKVGPAADIEVRKITSVMKCTPEATVAWESAPWPK